MQKKSRVLKITSALATAKCLNEIQFVLVMRSNVYCFNYCQKTAAENQSHPPKFVLMSVRKIN